ncbi:unnamed protein product [Ilex paraguariensis]|uniref:Uncharacterized protein n=1 Tax=Ilex paraguariensis TaxID=185542 RepID=A0ABC8RNX4_9AQUA
MEGNVSFELFGIRFCGKYHISLSYNSNYYTSIVSTLLNFVRMFVRAHDENCKQLEFEKKKALKEAENEKVKLSASKKDQDNEKMKTNAPKASKHLIPTQ